MTTLTPISRPPEIDHQCARCGSSTAWVDCWDCGGDGHHDGHEYDPLWYDEGDEIPCVTCKGASGWLVCCSGED